MKTTAMAISIAAFIAVAGCKSATTPVQASGNLSGSYSYIGGHGKVSWRNSGDHFNYVARDWNGDGRTEVLSLTSVYSRGKGNVSPHVFMSNGDGSYRVQNVGGTIRTLTTEYQGDYFSGPIIVGTSPGGDTTGPVLNCGGMHCSEIGILAAWHGATTADVDNDGKLDLIAFMSGTTIFSNFQPGPMGVHVGNGSTAHLGKIAMNTGAFAGTFRDLDGDGYPEMITGSYRGHNAYTVSGGAVPNGGITVWKNHGGKRFTVMQQLPGGSGRTGVRTIHQNGGDFVVYSECGDVCASNSSIRVYGTNGGRLHLKQQFYIDGPRDKGHPPRLVDVNGDGRRDLVVGLASASVSEQYRGIWLNNGNGTFRQLGTNIFAGAPKAGMRGYVIPTKANHDGRMDWIVVYEDGTFGTLMAPGGGGGSTYNNSGNSSNNGGGTYSAYVQGNGDLLAAFNNGVGPRGSMENWGKWHWNAYGKNEPHRKAKPSGKARVKVSNILKGGKTNSSNDPCSGRDHCYGDRFWQLNFVKDKLSVMSNSIINTNTMFSFNNVEMFDVYKIDENKAFTFGAIPADEYGNVESVVIGMAFGDTRIAIATDDTMLGWDPGQSLLNISNTKSRYINIQRTKSINDWTLSGNMTYALAQGNAGYGYVKDVEDFHAMGLGVTANYVIDEDSAVKFGVSQPLRIESGALHFNDVIADMTPYGREIDYTMSFTNKVSKTSTINLQLSYASDVNHFKGENDAKVMAVYKGTW